MTNVTLYYQPVFTLSGSPPRPQIVSLLFVLPADLATMARAALRIALNKPGQATVGDLQNFLAASRRSPVDVRTLLSEYQFQLQERPSSASNLAAFPMLPNATLTVGQGPVISFNSFVCDPPYLRSLNQRLALAAQADTASPFPVPVASESLAQLIVSDYFQILVTHAAQDAIAKLNNLPIDETALGGTVSRFLMHGLRLPDQSQQPTLQALYQLTGQQQPHEEVPFTLALRGQTVTVGPPDPRFPSLVGQAIADAAPTFDPTAAILALTTFPPYAVFPKKFNFGKPTVWMQGTASRLLYPLPQAFRRHISDHPGIPTNVTVAGNDTKSMAWATRFDFMLRAALDPETGVPIAGLFDIFSRSQAIASDLHGVAAADLTNASIQLVYASPSTGIVSDTSPVTKLIKSNLSAQRTGSRLVASASPTEPADFLPLLAECISVQDGGFFLSYHAESTSTFIALLNQTNEATITILVQGVSHGAVKPFHNCGIVEASQVKDPDSETLTIIPPTDTFAAGKTVDSLANATNTIAPGLLIAGTAITINGQARTILPGDDLLGLSLATGATLDQVRDDAITARAVKVGATIQMHRDWVIQRTTMAPGNVGFRMLLPDPTPSLKGGATPAQKVQQLFSLLSFRLIGNAAFTASDEGLPAAPSNGDNQDKNPPPGSPWIYQQILSLSKFVNPPNPLNPYAGVPATATLEFYFNDVFGNRFEGHPRTLDLPVLYRDDIFSLPQWPSLIATFEFNGSAPAPDLLLSLSFDSSRYADPKMPPARPRQDLARYQAIKAQISRNDVSISAATTPGSLQDADVTVAFRQFAQDAIAFLQVLTASQTTPAAPAASLSLPITAATLPVVFEVAATITIQRDAKNIDPLFADDATVQSSVSALRPNYDPTGGKPSLDEFARGFEAAFAPQNLKLLAGPRGDTSQLLHAVTFRTPQLDYQPGAAASFYAVPPLSTELFSGPVATTTYRGIDLDVWGRAFLHDLDLFLSPRFAAQIDADSYRTALQAKFDLAAAIAAHVRPIIDTPASNAALAAAAAALRERLLSHIADAYTIDTIVQLPVTVTYPAGQPARIAIRPNATSSATSSFSITGSDLELAAGPQFLNFLFSSKVESQFRNITLNTLFLEPRALTVGSDDPDYYIFVRPPESDQIAPAMTIPVPLRSYPVPPSLKGQSADQGDLPPNPSFADLRSYTYSFTYTFDNPANQDEIIDRSQFNVVTVAAATPAPDLLTALPAALARYAAMAPALARDFVDPLQSAAAFQVFANQARAIAEAWQGWQPTVTPKPVQQQPATNEPFDGGFKHKVSGLDIITHQNAIGGLQVRRNGNLLPGLTTNQAFVYLLPAVTFANPLVPLVNNQDEFDIGILDPSATTIGGHLAALFKSLLEIDETSPSAKGRLVRLAAAYEFVLARAGTHAIKTVVPVLLKPASLFDPTIDFGDKGVCAALDTELTHWKNTSGPPAGEGTWVFDVSVYSTIGDAGPSAPPLLELTNLRLQA